MQTPVSETTPPPPPLPKRPRSVTLALFGALLFGVGAAQTGSEDIQCFRGELAANLELPPLASETARASVKASIELLSVATERHRTAGIALGVFMVVIALVQLLLATQLFVVATRPKRTPSLLIQMVLAQAALIVASYVALPEYRWAKRDFMFNWSQAHMAAPDAKSAEQAQAVELSKALVRRSIPAVQGGYLVFRSMLSLLIVLALTRKRASEFYARVGV
jgi:hypothetical protein